jgi:hypothetical protein
MITEVFFFLSVFDKWKSGKGIVVISPWSSSILRRVENPGVCVRVSCAVACDIFGDHGAESFFKISRDISRILWDAKIHYRVHSVPILTQVKPVHALRSYFFKTRFNIIPPVTFMREKYICMYIYLCWLSSLENQCLRNASVARFSKSLYYFLSHRSSIPLSSLLSTPAINIWYFLTKIFRNCLLNRNRFGVS